MIVLSEISGAIAAADWLRKFLPFAREKPTTERNAVDRGSCKICPGYGHKEIRYVHVLVAITLGKQWKAKSTPNKNPSLRISFAKRLVKDKQAEATKALERQLREEKKAAEEVYFHE